MFYDGVGIRKVNKVQVKPQTRSRSVCVYGVGDNSGILPTKDYIIDLEVSLFTHQNNVIKRGSVTGAHVGKKYKKGDEWL